eukprot:TRINITY_DN2225_c0_g1_i2.p1 TRINITY_DN2225_c0_g1~~TRINITY_DN2225_c0_g1_i2.p1  ORF type:complete len:1043 (-),score=292.85 TRINITY_DN2225_c0_g1_i2:408-3536(-)
MKDSDRLELLKEVAGTKVYDERRTESTKIMEETDGKLEKIDEVLKYIEARLTELDSEKEELAEYQRLDREKRSIEYTLHNKEIQDINHQLEQLEGERTATKAKSDQLYDEIDVEEQKLQISETQQRQLADTIKQLESDKRLAENEKQENLQSKVNLELDVRDSEDRIKTQKEREVALKSELVQLAETIKTKTAELKRVEPLFQRELEEEKRISDELILAQAQLKGIYSKQGRIQQFSSKEARDESIRSDLRKLDAQLTHEKDKFHAERGILDQLRRDYENKSADIDQRHQGLVSRQKGFSSAQEDYNRKASDRNRLADERKDLQRRVVELGSNIAKIKEEAQKRERQLSSTTGQVTSKGVSAIKRLAQMHRIPGVFGPLIELIDLSDEKFAKFFTAIEVTAGNSLFDIVVDTDETASRLLELLNQERSGRVTFLPLNRLKVKAPELPSSSDAFPLIKRIKFDALFLPAFHQIFGRTLVVRNLEVGSAFSKSHDMNCITMEGDQVNRKGVLTGGYIADRQSRLACMKSLKELQQSLEVAESNNEKVQSQLEDVTTQIDILSAEMQRRQSQTEQERITCEQLALDLKHKEKELEIDRSNLNQRERTIAILESRIKELEANRSALAAEVGTELVGTLSSQEHKKSESLNESISNLQKRLNSVRKSRGELESQKSALEADIQTNLVRRSRSIEEELQSLHLPGLHSQYERLAEELEQVNTKISANTKRLTNAEKTLKDKLKELSKVQSAIDESKSSVEEHRRILVEHNQETERMFSRRLLLTKRRDEVMKQIRELGSLPQDAFERFSGMASKKLITMLHKCNDALKKYANVNKKALDQFTSFTEQRDRLLERKRELDQGKESIRELIEVLDRRKDEAIERTFKQTAKHFSEVFSEIVPGGRGSIVMISQDAAELDPTQPRFRNFVGVGVKVSFTGGSDVQTIQQLSGGQKSVVALALIFAIQRVDAAPFYIFDEVDSALDAAYRSALANMIHRQSDRAQFITTTFRPELVNMADKHYGIEFRNKVSRVRVIDRDTALELIEDQDAA